jgi:hypothetical protein
MPTPTKTPNLPGLKAMHDLGQRIIGNRNEITPYVSMYSCHDYPFLCNFLDRFDLSRIVCRNKIGMSTYGMDYVFIATFYPIRLTKDELEIFAPSPNELAWRQLEETDIHGVASLTIHIRKRNRYGKIEYICSRTKGIGSTLMRKIIDQSRIWRLRKLNLIAVLPAVLFYRKLGFVNNRYGSCDELPQIAQLAAKINAKSYTLKKFATDLRRLRTSTSCYDFPMVLCL